MSGPSRFISAVAFYGPKTGRLRELLTGVQALIAGHLGGDFRPYTLDQVHATLIALNGVRAGGTIVNEYLLEHAGERREMDLPRVMDILARRFATPLRVRIGGFRPEQAVPFTSRGQHLAERTFSVQGEAFVLVGWPADSLAGAGMPVDELRRDMNAAGVLHRYHARAGDVDRCRDDRREAGQQRGEERELVFAPAALQGREVGRDFLQAEDVEVGERARVVDDPLRVDAAVAAAAPLDVPGHELHGTPSRPARISGCRHA